MRAVALLVAGTLAACATAAPEPPFRIAFGSCLSQYQDQPILDTVVAAKPDLFLFLGDTVYVDWDGKNGVTPSIEKMKADYAMLAAKPEYKRLRKAVPVMATWDDHDYGTNDGGADFALKEQSREQFLRFFGTTRENPGVYAAKMFGDVQVILLDTRYFRGPLVRDTRSAEEKRAANVAGRYVPNDDPSVTMLGDAQWTWLEERLRESADVRLIVSSIQVVAGEKGAESWGNLPHERRRLYELIRRTGARGVVFLSGDVHFAELSRTDEGPYPLYDLTSSSLAQSGTGWEKHVNSHRVGKPYSGNNFGVVDIEADAIRLRIVGLDGATVLEHRIAREALR
ncbi:MAG: alkaline phosphatase D family protein [Planctomycetota bacterium]|jgi:alkaline phosphatase D